MVMLAFGYVFRLESIQIGEDDRALKSGACCLVTKLGPSNITTWSHFTFAVVWPIAIDWFARICYIELMLQSQYNG